MIRKAKAEWKGTGKDGTGICVINAGDSPMHIPRPTLQKSRFSTVAEDVENKKSLVKQPR